MITQPEEEGFVGDRPEVAGVVERLASDDRVLGVLVVGSAARDADDPLSDIDLEIVMDGPAPDGLWSTQVLAPQKPGERPVDLLFFEPDDFRAKAASPVDLDHWPYLDAKVLHDPVGFLADVLPAIIALPEDVRSARLQLHYFETIFCASRIRRLDARGNELNKRLVASTCAIAVAKLLFLLARSWPPMSHALSLELLRLPSGGRFEPLLGELVSRPSGDVAESVLVAVEQELLAAGSSFVVSRGLVAADSAGARFRPWRERHGIL